MAFDSSMCGCMSVCSEHLEDGTNSTVISDISMNTDTETEVETEQKYMDTHLMGLEDFIQDIRSQHPAGMTLHYCLAFSKENKYYEKVGLCI
jgi:uncharacterized protein YcbK (DUF882 family)